MVKILKKIFHKARRLLAKLWLRMNLQLTVIGVVGSYGKTNTAQAITAVLSQKYKTLRTDLNLDTIYNLPITILKTRPYHQKLILEYGVDHKGEMDFHLNLVKPHIAVLTGINPTHSGPGLLGSLKGVIEEKSKLLRVLPKDGLAVLNGDDEKVRKMAKFSKAKVCYFSLKDNEADFYVKDIKISFSGTSFKLLQKEGGNKKGVSIKTGLVGRHFIQSCLPAIAVGLYQGLTLKEIKRGLGKLRPLAGRLSIEKGPKGSILLNDSLRANPSSTLAGLETLADLPSKGKRIAVLGEMGELGSLAEKEHQKIGDEVAKLNIDYLVSVGSLQKLTAQQAIKSGMDKDHVFWAKDTSQAANLLKKILKKDDLFYLKGSLLKHMERTLLILENKKVNCKVNSCHFYHPCKNCLYLHKLKVRL